MVNGTKKTLPKRKTRTVPRTAVTSGQQAKLFRPVYFSGQPAKPRLGDGCRRLKFLLSKLGKRPLYSQGAHGSKHKTRSCSGDYATRRIRLTKEDQREQGRRTTNEALDCHTTVTKNSCRSFHLRVCNRATVSQTASPGQPRRVLTTPNPVRVTTSRVNTSAKNVRSVVVELAGI